MSCFLHSWFSSSTGLTFSEDWDPGSWLPSHIPPQNPTDPSYLVVEFCCSPSLFVFFHLPLRPDLVTDAIYRGQKHIVAQPRGLGVTCRGHSSHQRLALLHRLASEINLAEGMHFIAYEMLQYHVICHVSRLQHQRDVRLADWPRDKGSR